MKPECEPFAAAILDEEAPKPAGFTAHVVGCAGCTALRDAHWRALELKGTELPPAPRTRAAPVVLRAALAAGVLGLAVFALVPSAPAPQPIAAERPSPSPGELALVAPAPEAKPSLEALAHLNQTVVLYARVDPVAHGYGAQFGSLPALFAPSPVSQELP